MTKKLWYLLFLLSISTFSQEPLGRPFFTGDLNFTLGINENYEAFQDGETGTLIVPAALFLRLGMGYEFKKRIGVSVNTGYDYHWNNATSAFPAYFGLRYNITNKDDDAHFIEVRYGKMWRPSNKFPDGNYYGVGLGLQIAGEERWNSVFRIDFHRKGILGFKNNRLDSFSFGFGFTFF